jgi:L-threonylcarbamoyladenylate synthase
MQTTVLAPDAEGIARAAAALRAGALVAYPTDTVYGLGAHLFLPQAVARIYEVKGRVENKPIAVLLAEVKDLDRVAAYVPPAARRLGERYWPGALTLVLPARGEIPAVVVAGGATVGVRAPDHPVARALIAAAGVPLATTSANRSGEPSPTTTEQVLAQLGGRVEYVVAGVCPGGVESTVVDLASDPPVILRQGAIAEQEIWAALGGRPREQE